jgi:hypothetical protein
MKSLKKKTILTGKLCIFMLGCFSFQNVWAQTPAPAQAPGAAMGPGGPGRAPVDPVVAAAQAAAQAKIDAEKRVVWQNEMDMLHLKVPTLVPATEDPTRPPNLTQKNVKSIYWFDSAGNQLSRTTWGNWTNYDESKANNYVLPDVLKLNNGKPVTKAADWVSKRRPEILDLYEKEIYGYIPKTTSKVTFEVVSVDTNAVDGTAIMKTIVGHR